MEAVDEPEKNLVDAETLSTGSDSETSDSEASDVDDSTIDLSTLDAPTLPPCPDCRQTPAPGQTVCICGLPLARSAPAAPAAPAPPKAKPKPANKPASKVHRWYVEVGRRLTGVPRFVIKEAQQVYRKALKETQRHGCTQHL